MSFEALGCRVRGFRAKGSRLRVQGLGFRVKTLGFRGIGFR